MSIPETGNYLFILTSPYEETTYCIFDFTNQLMSLFVDTLTSPLLVDISYSNPRTFTELVDAYTESQNISFIYYEISSPANLRDDLPELFI